MEGNDLWWDGEIIGQGVIALAVFPRGQQGSTEAKSPGLGAASAGANGVAFLPTEFGAFLQKHRQAILACYDAASLHWLLAGHLRTSNDADSLAALWAFSRESRLVDIMLLDQHVRRLEGKDGTVARPLSRLTKERAKATLPPDEKIQRLMASAWQNMSQSSDTSAPKLGKDVAAAVFQAYENLRDIADTIVEGVKKANQLPPYVFPPLDNAEEEQAQSQKSDEWWLRVSRQTNQSGPVKVASREDDEESIPTENRLFGPLGVGVDVKGAIALQQPGRPGLRVDPEQVAHVLDNNRIRLQQASARLSEDPEARRCFRWRDDGRVVLDEQGRPEHDPQALKTWLRGIEERLCDVHNLPITVPTTNQGDPSFDPERWGLWAAVDRSLRAWRDLKRSAQLERYANADTIRTVFEVVPFLRSRELDLTALCSLHVPLFMPHSGNVFVVGSLQLLRIRCFAAVCRLNHYSLRGRLEGYFLECEDPIGEVGGELHGHVLRIRQPLSETEGEDDEPGVGFESISSEDMVYNFSDPKKVDDQEYRDWRRLAQALLELLPLGLPASSVSALLALDYGLDAIPEAKVRMYQKVLEDKVVYELTDFVDDDILGRLARRLGLTPTKGVVELAELNNLNTSDAALRRDLLYLRKGRPVWRFIENARDANQTSTMPSDEVIVDQGLYHSGFTAAGRVVGRAFCAEVRRQQIFLTADEVMKSVAYDLVARGFCLVAVDDNHFVLEIPQEQMTGDLLSKVGRLAYESQKEILGNLAAPCLCEQALQW